MNKQPVFNKLGLFENLSCPISENLSRQGFYLPSGLGIKDEEIQYVANQFIEIINNIQK